jgi:plastocyanin
MNLKTVAATLAVLLGASACSLAEPAPPPSPAVPTASPQPASTSGAAAAPAATEVDPRRGGFEVGFGEFAITLEAAEIRPGPVTFVIRNGGRLVHGFEIEIEGRDSSGPGSGDGFKLEGPLFGPGDTLRFPMTLAPGVYEVECFVAEHDDMGMRATLLVRPGAPLVREVRAPAAPDRVEIADFAFSPGTLEVPVGSDVTWRNADPTAHTVSARDGAFDSGTVDPGAAFGITFERAGTFEYFCQIHPTMRGSVRVVGTG